MGEKAFDPDEYLSDIEKNDAFDPDEYLAELEKSDESVSVLESGLRGAAQGATFGYADELVGVVGSLSQISQSDKELDDYLDLYRQQRDESREKFKMAEEANPKAYATGDIGASIATALVPIGSAATAGKAIATGIGIGALEGSGRSEDDSATELAKDTLSGAALGAAGAGIGKAVEKGYKSLRKPIATFISKSDETRKINPFTGSVKTATQQIGRFFSPLRANDYPEMQRLAKKFGIEEKMLPESVEFGQDSFISRAARKRAEGVLGEPYLKLFNAEYEKLKNVYDNKISALAGGKNIDRVSAGQFIRDTFDDGVDSFFKKIDFTHNSVVGQVPGLPVSEEAMQKISSKLNGIEKFAIGRAQRGITNTQRTQGQQLINAIEAVRSGSGSYKQMLEAMNDIGDVAFKSKNYLADIPPDVEKMRDLYFTISEGLISTVRKNLGDDIANSLIENNKAMTKLFGDKSMLASHIGNKNLSPEKLFDNLIVNGDSNKIQALKNIIAHTENASERLNYIKGAFLDSVASRDPEGMISFRGVNKSLQGKKVQLSELFGQGEIKDLGDLVRFGDRFGIPIMSTSGTGASNSFMNILNSIAIEPTNSLIIESSRKAARNPPISGVSEPPRFIQDLLPKTSGRLIAPIQPMKIEGFQEHLTQPVSEMEQALFENDIKKNTNMNNLERYRRLQLLRRHGRIYLGQ